MYYVFLLIYAITVSGIVDFLLKPTSWWEKLSALAVTVFLIFLFLYYTNDVKGLY